MGVEYTATAYPPAIFNRSTAGQAAPVARGPATPPRQRLFTVELGANAGQRRTTSTPRLIGPAIVQTVSFEAGIGDNPFSQFCEIGYSKAPITETGELVGAAKPWNKLMERLANPFGYLTQAAVGLPALQNSINRPMTVWPLNLVITEPDFFLTISLLNHSAAATAGAIWCTVSVLEGVNPEALLNFL
jgi:hypothetical protein